MCLLGGSGLGRRRADATAARLGSLVFARGRLTGAGHAECGRQAIGVERRGRLDRCFFARLAGTTTARCRIVLRHGVVHDRRTIAGRGCGLYRTPVLDLLLAILAGTLVTLRAIVTAAVGTRPIFALGTVVALCTLLTLGTVVALDALLTLGTVVALDALLALGTVIALRTLLTLRTVVALRTLVAEAITARLDLVEARLLLGADRIALVAEVVTVVELIEVVTLAAHRLVVGTTALIGKNAEIMIRELQIIFRVDPVAGHLGVAGHVLVLFEQLGRVAACAAVDAIAAVTLPLATAAALTLLATTTAATAAVLTVVDQITVLVLEPKPALAPEARVAIVPGAAITCVSRACHGRRTAAANDEGRAGVPSNACR